MHMKYRIKRIVLVIAGMVVVSFCTAQSVTYTLKQCIETGLANNLTIKQSDLQRQNAVADYDQARYNRLPTLNAAAGYGINNGRSIDPFTNGYITQQLNSSGANADLSVPVYNGGRIQQTIRQNEKVSQASAMDLQQERDNLTLNIILNYLQVLNNEDLLVLARKQAEVTRAQVERMEVLNKEGAVAPSELTDLKGQYASEQINVMNAELSVQTSKLALAQLMNLPSGKDIQLVREAETALPEGQELTAERIYETALQQLAIVKANAFRQQAAAAGVKVAKADLYPTLSLFGQVSTNYSSAALRNNLLGSSDLPNGDYVVVNANKIPVISTVSSFSSQKISFGDQFTNNVGTYVGVSARVPIFNAFQTRTRIRQARIREETVRTQGDQLKLQLRQNIETAFLNWQNAGHRYKTLQEQVVALEESFRAAEVRFTEGAWNAVQYLIVKNNLDRARANQIIAQYEYRLRSRVLDFYRGVQAW